MASRYVEAIVALIDEIVIVTLLIYIFLYFLGKRGIITTEDIIIISIIYIIIISYVTYRVAQLQASQAKIGLEALIGLEGEAIEDLDPEGKILLEGEIWTAVSANGETIKRGDRIRVVGNKGLVLYVERLRR